MSDYTVVNIWNAARKTLTAALGVTITALAGAAENIETIYAQVPQLEPYLPAVPAVHTGIHYLVGALGIGVAVARVRRMIWPPKP